MVPLVRTHTTKAATGSFLISKLVPGVVLGVCIEVIELLNAINQENAPARAVCNVPHLRRQEALFDFDVRLALAEDS